MIHQPVSLVLQSGAGVWLYRLASRDQHRLMGSGSTSEVCSWRRAIQIHRYFTLLYFLTPKLIISCRQSVDQSCQMTSISFVHSNIRFQNITSTDERTIMDRRMERLKTICLCLPVWHGEGINSNYHSHKQSSCPMFQQRRNLVCLLPGET